MGHRSRRTRQPRFVTLPNATVDHFEKRSPIALGLLAINLRHATGYPITLTRVQDNAQHGSRKQLAEARHILIDDAYAIYLRYTVRGQDGGRPEWESLTQYADTPHAVDELEELVTEHTPGRWLVLKDSPRRWRRVQIVSAQVVYWEGTWKITHEGLLEEPKKPGRKPGSSSRRTRSGSDGSGTRGSNGRFGG